MKRQVEWVKFASDHAIAALCTLCTLCLFPTNFLYLVGQPWACSKGSWVLEKFFGHWSDCSRACLCHRYHSSLLPTLLIPLLNLPLLSLLFPVHIPQVLLLSIPSQWRSAYPCLVLLYLACRSGLMHDLWWCSYYKPGVSYRVTSLSREMLLRSSSLSSTSRRKCHELPSVSKSIFIFFCFFFSFNYVI